LFSSQSPSAGAASFASGVDIPDSHGALRQKVAPAIAALPPSMAVAALYFLSGISFLEANESASPLGDWEENKDTSRPPTGG
jgi:hypothetical protein